MNSEFSPGVEKRRSRLPYIGFALGLAGLYDLFFWEKLLGLNFPLFVFIYLAGFICITHFTQQLKNKWAFVLLAPIAIMSINVMLYNNTLVQNWVPLFVFILTAAFSILSTLNFSELKKLAITRIPLVRNGFRIFQKYGALYHDLFESKGEVATYKKVALGTVIALPILIVFGALFAQADAIFDELAMELLDFSVKDSTIWRAIRTFVFTLVGSLFFYSLISNSHRPKEGLVKVLKLDSTIAATVLVLVNLLFAIFVFIQIKYLFGGAEFISQHNLSFAQYARSGFFELVWIMGFAGLLFAFIYRSFASHQRSKIIDFLQVLLAAQVSIVALSALKRMNLYQAAYGYTILRLYVEWFIYFTLTLIFTGITSTIFRIKFNHLVHASLGVGILATTLVSSINVDYMITKKNIHKFNEGSYEKGRSLDIWYLGDLSVDVMPALKQIEDVHIQRKIRANTQWKKHLIYGHDSLLEYNLSIEKARNFFPEPPKNELETNPNRS